MAIAGGCKPPDFGLRRFESYFQHQNNRDNHMSNKIYTFGELKIKIGRILSAFPVKKAILFGSYARGEADNKSDIDLVIDSDGRLRGLDFYEVLGRLQEGLEKDVDLIEKREIIKGGKVDKEVAKTGVMIYGE